MNQNPNIVAIGGGSGLTNLFKGLKKYQCQITAIVGMTDDGRSSGTLRRDFGSLPLGDLRNCLVALADDSLLMSQLFNFRFKRGKLKKESFGNLFLFSLIEICGSLQKALEVSSYILNVYGKVLPSTLEDIHLKAVFEDGKVVSGETKIIRYGYKMPIKKVFLSHIPKAYNKAVSAIKKADLIVIGPGSLYTSIMPNLLIPEITRALKKSKALKIFICNVSTERGETDRYSAEDHIKSIISHTGMKFLDVVLVNSIPFPKNSGDGFINPLAEKRKEINGIKIISKNLVASDNFLYHDPQKLAKEIFNILKWTKSMKK